MIRCYFLTDRSIDVTLLSSILENSDIVLTILFLSIHPEPVCYLINTRIRFIIVRITQCRVWQRCLTNVLEIFCSHCFSLLLESFVFRVSIRGKRKGERKKKEAGPQVETESGEEKDVSLWVAEKFMARTPLTPVASYILEDIQPCESMGPAISWTTRVSGRGIFLFFYLVMPSQPPRDLCKPFGLANKNLGSLKLFVLSICPSYRKQLPRMI